MYTDFLAKAKAIVEAHRREYVGVYFMFGGGSPSGSTTSTNVTTPWSGQQAFLSGASNPNLTGSAAPTGVFQSAAQLYNNPSDYPQMYPGASNGSMTSPFTPLESSAYGAIGNTGLNSSLMNQDAATQQSILSGSMLSSGNPYQQAELQSLNSQITPQLESQFTQGNAMNNPGAAYAVGQGIGSADANILGQNYNTGLNQLTQESVYAPNTYNAQLQGQEAAATAGQAQQTQAQNTLNGQINAYNYNQQLPYQMLQNYAELVNGNYGGTSTTSQPYYNNTGSQFLQAGTQLGSAALMAAMLA